MRPLDPAEIALRGPSLIEASAGTGKTWTLTALYLRLVLEMGLDPAQILVVTFTKAATAELRGRIRNRLRDARLALSGQGEPDDTLRAVLARAGDAQALSTRLESALLRMDEAAIYTIHGFCQRVLQDHAFESGMLFDLEFEGEDAAAGLQVMQDFWRTRFRNAPPELAAFVLQCWGEPAGLWEALRALVTRADQARLAPPPAWASTDAALQALDALWRRAAALWTNGGEPLGEVLKAYPGWNGNKYRRLAADLDELHAYFAQGSLALAVPDCGKRYLPAKIATGFKKGYEPPVHDFFAAWEALCEGVARLPAVVLHEALGYAMEALRERRREARRLAYDDLLRELHEALHGPRAEELARGIRARHPVALIDEFQDTDAVQYGIFRRVYGPTERGGLFMIGDPKQAIYSFRGGDIFTYMRARDDAPPDAHYTLTRNWRSTTALVDALNTLFGSARAPFIESKITFHPVEAAGEADAAPLRVEGATPAPLQVWQLPDEAQTKGAAEGMVAEAVAGEIARLLAAGAQGRAQLGEAPLRAADLAVLVPTRRHAALVQGALRACGVRSAYTGQDSVYATEEAEELGRVLYAIAHPAEEGALRGALLTRLVGVDVPTLAALAEDERAWEAWLARFQRFHEHWRVRGFMAMFRGLLRELEVAPRLLGALGGERRLTNLLQLGELLQEAARTRPPAALLRWLAQQRDQGAAEEQMLRLESDEGLVHIVTIHSSKGLEYPVVFLPFPWHGKTLRKNEPLLFHDEHTGALTLDLEGSDESHRARAAQEALAESLRLLYVALTRAKTTCYLAWGPVNGAHESALAYLLYEDAARAGQSVAEAVKALTPPEWWTPWDRLAQQGHARLAPLPENAGRAPLPTQNPPALAARRFGGRIARGWRIESYSNLVAQLEAPHMAAPLPAEDAPRDIHTFPRGAQAGTCLHAVLEGLDFQSAPHERAPELARVLARYGYARQWQGVVERLVHDVLHAPLNAAGLRLAQVAPEARRPEIEFYFPLAPLRAERIDACLRRAWTEPCEFPALPSGTLEGMMRGFIDLVVESAGRFYVIDYKSNYLGADATAYARPALAAAVAQHRYDAQYLLYTVALHRYLAQRVPDYAYARHMGGVFYLFLRGMHADAPPGQGVFDARPPYEVVAELDALLRGEGA